jgi:transposase
VVGFLNVLTGKLVRAVRQRGRGEDIAAGVQALGDAEVRRLLIWDNAPPHQGRVARGAAEALGIEIVKLPFRSPELNPLEDLWRSLKAVVAANRAYESVEELAERAVDYFDSLSEDDVLRLSGLLSSKFNWLPTYARGVVGFHPPPYPMGWGWGRRMPGRSFLRGLGLFG